MFKACSVIWRNEAYLLGGRDERKQISKLFDCELRRIGTLPFDFVLGGCAVGKNLMFMCFHPDTQKCYKTDEPLGSRRDYSQTEKTKFEHQMTRIAASDSEIQFFHQ